MKYKCLLGHDWQIINKSKTENIWHKSQSYKRHCYSLPLTDERIIDAFKKLHKKCENSDYYIQAYQGMICVGEPYVDRICRRCDKLDLRLQAAIKRTLSNYEKFVEINTKDCTRKKEIKGQISEFWDLNF